MATNRFVLQAVMEKMKNLVDTLTLYVEQVFYRVYIILVPFELQTVLATQHVEDHLALLLWLEHIPVEQIIDFLVVKLQEGDVDSKAPIAHSLRQTLHELASAALDQTHLVRLHGLLNLWFKLPFGTLNVLVALHSESLARACLSVSENRAMIAVNNLLDHAFHTDRLIERPLIHLTIANTIEAERLRLLVSRIELQRDTIIASVELHLATCVRLRSFGEDRLSLDERTHAHDYPNFVKDGAISVVRIVVFTAVITVYIFPDVPV
mmetsp:Transcript_37640/g.45805  ORF Transcript_37640/g.45805 Transcript_37640/m.45805 type:complete len:265 (+) Transcript_37640:1870-2664(+)